MYCYATTARVSPNCHSSNIDSRSSLSQRHGTTWYLEYNISGNLKLYVKNTFEIIFLIFISCLIFIRSKFWDLIFTSYKFRVDPHSTKRTPSIGPSRCVGSLKTLIR